MTRPRAITELYGVALSLGLVAEGTEWHLFGSIDRDEPSAKDIDLMILCRSDEQADNIRRAINPDQFVLPLHLALLTFDEAADIGAVPMQQSHVIFPCPVAAMQSNRVCSPARPNHSLKLTRYGMRCLAAPGQVCYFPSAAKQCMPPRAA